jgi:hypothetical protein
VGSASTASGIHAVESLISGNFSLGKETCRKFICPYIGYPDIGLQKRFCPSRRLFGHVARIPFRLVES